MQDGKRKIPIHFGVKRLKVKVTTEDCQYFSSNTLSWVDSNIQLESHILFIEEETGEKDIYKFEG